MTMYKIALIGYGKMGHTIQDLALQKGHSVPLTIDDTTDHDLEDLSSDIDVAIEFTRPESAFNNITACLKKGIPVVSGTTGWLDQMPQVKDLCEREDGAFFYASNYSIGVNLFFLLNEFLAEQMDNFPEYDITMKEIHHTQKLDAPSGTAITLAEGLLTRIKRKDTWIGEEGTPRSKDVLIKSERIADTPGTHSVTYQSDIDSIEIQHTAFNRLGFAKGALTAAEWLVGKRGCYGMRDLLGF